MGTSLEKRGAAAGKGHSRQNGQGQERAPHALSRQLPESLQGFCAEARPGSQQSSETLVTSGRPEVGGQQGEEEATPAVIQV